MGCDSSSSRPAAVRVPFVRVSLSLSALRLATRRPGPRADAGAARAAAAAPAPKQSNIKSIQNSNQFSIYRIDVCGVERVRGRDLLVTYLRARSAPATSLHAPQRCLAHPRSTRPSERSAAHMRRSCGARRPPRRARGRARGREGGRKGAAGSPQARAPPALTPPSRPSPWPPCPWPPSRCRGDIG